MDICKHSDTVLNHELSKGNNVLDYSKAWLQVDLAVTLESPMDIDGIKQVPSDTTMHWTNTDTHYTLQDGIPR